MLTGTVPFTGDSPGRDRDEAPARRSRSRRRRSAPGRPARPRPASSCARSRRIPTSASPTPRRWTPTSTGSRAASASRRRRRRPRPRSSRAAAAATPRSRGRRRRASRPRAAAARAAGLLRRATRSRRAAGRSGRGCSRCCCSSLALVGGVVAYDQIQDELSADEPVAVPTCVEARSSRRSPSTQLRRATGSRTRSLRAADVDASRAGLRLDQDPDAGRSASTAADRARHDLRLDGQAEGRACPTSSAAARREAVGRR